MWDLGNRDIIVLVSVISGWAVLLNIFGPYLASTITLLLVVFGWFTCILLDGTPLTPHALLVLDYVEQALCELNSFLKSGYRQFAVHIALLIRYICHLYRVNIVERMAQHRRSTYQLSLETHASTRQTSRLGLVDGLSPIPRSTFRQVGSSSNAENTPYPDASRRLLQRAGSLEHVTSTPLISWRKEDTRNDDVLSTSEAASDRNAWKGSQSFSHTHTLPRREESADGLEGSPWGTSISPKMRARATGVKTVQTVAGPLLASTRYNIDPKVYSDVTSPGLTTRLTRYATEANTKLTHQSQYRTGQFPRVNLSASPAPLITTKTGKLRSPVTVRIAPPENTRYSPPERQQILSEICHVESKAQPSVVQVLREISLKRHASREDVTFELAKKQRTESVFGDGLENLEEMTQKRARDDSSRSEEDVSPQNKSLRPAKRSKMPSCHDILSSLSSSINVSSGVKRKAIDVSRSGTPDVGKHFKSLDSSHGDGTNLSPLSRSISEPTKPMKRLLNDTETRNSDRQRPNKKSLETIPHKGMAKVSGPGKESLNAVRVDAMQTDPEIVQRDVKTTSDRNVSKPVSSPVRLTDKLFMKAEPENIDKIKTLIEEHGTMKPRFTTDSTDEIKKSDIVNMRQTSMKNRLKSMFDAISGKATSKIDPEVVIQAEDKSANSQIIVASLSSSTSTTTVNTSPIATSAIVPIIGKAKTATSPTKHVTFQFGNESAPKVDNVGSPKFSTSETKTSGIIKETKSPDNSVVAEKLFSSNSALVGLNHATSSTSLTGAPSIFTNAPIPTSQQSLSSAQQQATKSPTSTNSPMSSVTPAAPQLNAQVASPVTNVPLFGNMSSSLAKPVSSLPSFSMPANEKTTQPAASFVFGTPKTTSAASSSPSSSLAVPQISAAPASQVVSSISAGTTAPTSTSSGLFAFGAATKPTHNESSNTSTFEGLRDTEKKVFTFGATTASNSGFQTPGVASANRNSSNTSFQATGIATTNQNSTTSTGFQASGITSINKNSSNISFQPPSIASANQNSSNTGFQAPVIGTTNQNSTSTGSGFNLSTSNAIFGAPSTSTTTPSTGFSSTTSTSSAIAFGTNTTATGAVKSGFTFGTNSAVGSAATTTSSSVPSLPFGVTSTNTAVPVFGGISKTFTTATTQSSVFGTPTTTASSITTQPNLFGTPSTTSSATTTQPSIFGTPVTTSSGFAGNTVPSVFGTGALQPSSFPATSSASTTFGAAKTQGTPTPASPSAASSSFAATTKSLGLFSGASTAANATTSAALPSFASGAFNQKPATAFGANTATTSFSASTGNSASSFESRPVEAFGSASSSSGGTVPTYGFSNNQAPSFGTPSTGPPAFGATTATTSFSANTGNATSLFESRPVETFGSSSSSSGGTVPTYGFSNNLAPSFGTPSTGPPTFGSTNTTTTSFGAATTVTPTFGTLNTTATAFGTSNSGVPTAGQQSVTSTNFSAPGATFGATTTAPPAFPTSSSSGFGSSSGNTAFSGSTNPPPAFSTSTSFTRFGTTPNAPLSFGGQATSANTSFGTTTTANTPFGDGTNSNNVNASFTFGASQPNPQQPQPNAVFTFSGAAATPANNATGGSTPFQFGAATPQTGGFNFSGAPGAPAINFSKDGAANGSFSLPTPGVNSFSVPPTVGGMFSIGAGSTAPRSRPSRRRQR